MNLPKTNCAGAIPPLNNLKTLFVFQIPLRPNIVFAFCTELEPETISDRQLFRKKILNSSKCKIFVCKGKWVGCESFIRQ